MDNSEIRGVIPTSARMQQEILASHRRSEQYGISREERNEHQQKLSPTELKDRKQRNRDLLSVVTAHIEEFYQLLSPEDFMVALVDRDGYILHFAGSEQVKILFAERNCAPGYRWTERDVGTSAISVCLEKQFSIQLNDRDHYCKRAHGFTSSAAPIFGKDGTLQGVLVVSGASKMIHPHTLIMITMAARSIEKQMRLLRRNQEMLLYAGFLDRVIESAETGLLTLDTEMRIWKTNQKGKQILKQHFLEGKPVSVLKGLDINLEELQKNPGKWKEREMCLQVENEDVHCYCSAKPVVSRKKELLGAVMVFEEFSDIRKLADRISGTEPFFTFDLLIGQSPSFLEAVEIARRAAKSDSTVLLLGETGTGKELFAQAIHNGGKRRHQTFVPINCGAIPGELLESELFGYVDGAFTGASRKGKPGKFELANGGTLLLDEIGDMPHDMQVKLLRVLQTGELQRIGASNVTMTDARIIAATHVDLQKMIALKRFRKDLFYRLNIIQIILPPLRERVAEDIETLALHFIKRYGPDCRLSGNALDCLLNYDWPGNIRELENTIQRALHLCNNGTMRQEHLGIQASSSQASRRRGGTLKQMERELIEDTLLRTSGNMARTARNLGISRATLYRKVREFGLETVPQ
ncbi:MAG: sigma 54-interacting transcriptional regulator [Desulfocapsaceae bacterium]|nr:sigma 54-interacting transcriptional regulator [Desulfocapsaceae bacterium]